MKVAHVRFPQSPEGYDYEIPKHLEPGIAVGTSVVVDSPRVGYSVAVVEEIFDRVDSEWDGSFKVLVDYVRDEHYKEHLAKESRREKILNELSRLASEAEVISNFERIAQSSDNEKGVEMQGLLSELRGL